MPTPTDGHLEAFIDAFIVRAHRGGWRNALLERPDKAVRRLRTFERQLDTRYCSLGDDADAMLHSLVADPASARVVYFDGRAPPRVVSVEEARDAWEGNRDAIVSAFPGRLAVFLFHEGWAWRCERT